MLPIFAALGSLLQIVIPNMKSIAEVFVGNKATRDQYNAEADKAAQESFAKEFSYPLGAARTKFDIIMDAINRLPRPMITFSLFFMILLTCLIPSRMAEAYRAMALIPEMLWNITLVVIGFWFAGRMLERVSWKGYKPSPAGASYADPGAEPDAPALAAPRAARAVQDEAFSGLGLVSAQQRDELLALAGYGPGVLTTKGFTGSLPPSRTSGWRNPVCLQYRTATE